ncbi:hypothetical protein P7K49_033509 [Saguinus oedipus]|uniref:DUF7819 domain-containing protein n=1 Tax=Saguinus oedipus TaxID=9490 RepID=A0ABQ9TS46_SAGOE|nr:hypothetical protein P7K49_033509 [Saguinus oedipus]
MLVTATCYPLSDIHLELEDHEYKPLDPKDIRLPPPMPPSERLLAAVEAFYSPPSHDRPRNRYGAWCRGPWVPTTSAEQLGGKGVGTRGATGLQEDGPM